jgi:PleD family two-component response regulator
MSLRNSYKSFYSEGVAAEHPDVAGQKEFANKADEILAKRKRNREQSGKNAKTRWRSY